MDNVAGVLKVADGGHDEDTEDQELEFLIRANFVSEAVVNKLSSVRPICHLSRSWTSNTRLLSTGKHG